MTDLTGTTVAQRAPLLRWAREHGVDPLDLPMSHPWTLDGADVIFNLWQRDGNGVRPWRWSAPRAPREPVPDITPRRVRMLRPPPTLDAEEAPCP